MWEIVNEEREEDADRVGAGGDQMEENGKKRQTNMEHC